MPRRDIRPYDRQDAGDPPKPGFIAIIASVALHLGAVAVFIVIGSLHGNRIPENNVISVEIIGGDETRVEDGLDKKPEQTDKKPEQTDKKPEQTDKKPEQTDKKPEQTDKKPEQTDKKPEQTDKKPESTGKNKKPDTPVKETGSTGNGSGSTNDLDKAINDVIAGLATQRGADGQHIDAEQARYYAHIRDIISQNWLAPGDDELIDFMAAYKIVIQPDGQLYSGSLLKPSGNDLFDLSVERAVKSSSPFPPLPEAFGGKAAAVQLNFSLNELRRGR